MKNAVTIWTLEDAARPWTVLAAFAVFVGASALAMAIVVQLWIAFSAPVPAHELLTAAQASPFLSHAQIVLGTFLGVLAGFLACHWAGATGLRNALLVGVVMTGYALLSVAVHRDLAWWQHSIHVALPIPLALIGGAVWMYMSSRTTVRRD